MSYISYRSGPTYTTSYRTHGYRSYGGVRYGSTRYATRSYGGVRWGYSTIGTRLSLLPVSLFKPVMHAGMPALPPLNSFSVGSGQPLDINGLTATLRAYLEGHHLFAKPFLVGWYNETRKSDFPNNPQLLRRSTNEYYGEGEEYPPDTVAFILFSGPYFFDHILQWYANVAKQGNLQLPEKQDSRPQQSGDRDIKAGGKEGEEPAESEDRGVSEEEIDRSPDFQEICINDFLDDAALLILQGVIQQCCPSLGFQYHPVNQYPFLNGPTLGAITSISQSVDEAAVAKDDPSFVKEMKDEIGVRDRNWFGDDNKKVYPVTVHPDFGGYFQHRLVLVLENVRSNESVIPRAFPPKFLSLPQKRRILREFNLSPSLGIWRDLYRPEDGDAPPQPPKPTFSPEAYLYHHCTDPRVRDKYTELKAVQLGVKQLFG